MSSGEPLDLHMTPEEFAAEHAALLGVEHVNKFAYAASSSAARCLAQRGDLIDDFVFAAQALARHIYDGTGSPEGAVTAPVGSIYVRTDGGSGTSLYSKESGTGNTGWSALTSAATLSGLVRSGTGSPESVVTAGVGTLFLRTDGAAGTTLYRKESGAGNTGWVAQNVQAGDLTFTGAASVISLGLQASSGNAQVRFLKGNANNQSTLEWRNDGVAMWAVQHDSLENLNVRDGSGVVMALEQTGKRVRAANGVRRGGTSGPTFDQGTGSPEGVVTAPVGSHWTRTDGAAGTVLYVKETGAGNTGWVAYGVITQAQLDAISQWITVREVDFAGWPDTDFATGGDTTYALNDGSGALTWTAASTANANGGSDTNGGRFRRLAGVTGSDGAAGLQIFHDPSVNTALNTSTNSAPRLTIPLSSLDPTYDETAEYRLEVHLTRYADSSAGSIPASFFAAMFLRQVAGTPAGSVVRQVGVGLDRNAANNGQGTVIARNGNRAPVSAYDFTGGYNVLALQFGPHQIAQAMLGIYSGGWPAPSALRTVGTTSDTTANAALAAAVNMRDNLVTLSAVVTTNGTGSVDSMYRRIRLLRRVR